MPNNSDAQPNTQDFLVLPVKPMNPPSGVIRFYAGPDGKPAAIDSTVAAAWAGATPPTPAGSFGATINVKAPPFNAFGDPSYASIVSISRTAPTLTLPAGSTAKIGQLIQCA